MLTDRSTVLTLQQSPIMFAQGCVPADFTPGDHEAVLAARGALSAARSGPAMLAAAISASRTTLGTAGADAVVLAHGAPATVLAERPLLAMLADGAAATLLAHGLQTTVLAQLLGASMIAGRGA